MIVSDCRGSSIDVLSDSAVGFRKSRFSSSDEEGAGGALSSFLLVPLAASARKSSNPSRSDPLDTWFNGDNFAGGACAVLGKVKGAKSSSKDGGWLDKFGRTSSNTLKGSTLELMLPLFIVGVASFTSICCSKDNSGSILLVSPTLSERFPKWLSSAHSGSNGVESGSDIPPNDPGTTIAGYIDH